MSKGDSKRVTVEETSRKRVRTSMFEDGNDEADVVMDGQETVAKRTSYMFTVEGEEPDLDAAPMVKRARVNYNGAPKDTTNNEFKGRIHFGSGPLEHGGDKDEIKGHRKAPIRTLDSYQTFAVPADRRKHSLDTDADVNTLPPRSSVNPVHSRGRDQPVAPQSIVAVNVSADKGKFEERSRKLNPMVPVGKREDFRIKQGDWAYVERSRASGGRRKRRTKQGQSDMEIVACVNGLDPSDTDLIFVGQAATENHADDPKRDDMSSLEAFGTGTGVNTGPNEVRSARKVMFSRKPLIVPGNKPTDPVKPGISIEGVSDTRFVPATYTPSETCVSNAAATVIAKVDAAIDAAILLEQRSPSANPDATTKLVLDAATKAADTHFNTSFWGLDMNPMHIYARHYVLNACLVAIEMRLPAARSGYRVLFDAALKLVREEKAILSRGFVTLPQVPGGRKDTSATDALVSDLGKSTAGNDLIDLKTRLWRYLQFQMVVAQEQQQNYQSDHTMGWCINGSPGTGLPFDMIKGLGK